MEYARLADWLINTVGVGAVAGGIYWGFDQIKSFIGRRPLIWAIARVSKTSHTSWLYIHVRNRDQVDLYIESVTILSPAGLKVEDNFGYAHSTLRLEKHVLPCPPYAGELPGVICEARFEEPVSVIAETLKLRVAIRSSGGLRKTKRYKVSAVISRPP